MRNYEQFDGCHVLFVTARVVYQGSKYWGAKKIGGKKTAVRVSWSRHG